uniref:ABC-type nitrate/sulfonate/bicarbonate transport system, permease component n=1 Tax=Candidatus Kentrum sp. LPFa TaxID=2126335 RepID=A0A450VY27_9GAMM|nr:MAG: ABC-type nitrate/sulfonate/bicarbonate transport system, permease component [Candidatus Kentron sp. LPFa]
MREIFAGRFSLSDFASWFGTGVILAVLWAFLSTNTSTSEYFPTLPAVWSALLEDSATLSRHFWATARSSMAGFALGMLAAILSTMFTVLWQPARQVFSFIAIVLYSIPLIAAAPLSALIFGTHSSGTALGCIGAFLPIYLSGIQAGDRASRMFGEMERSYGASEWDITRTVRLPLIVRGWFIGAQSGWLWAVLGALLGDFTGGRWGLGTFLVGTLSRGDPARVWVIVLLCVLLSLLGLLAIKIAGRVFGTDSSWDTLESTVPMESTANNKKKRNVATGLAQMAVFLIVWQFTAWMINIDGGVFSSPLDLLDLGLSILFGSSEISINYLLIQFGSTFFLAFTGIAVSLTTAFAVASLQYLFPILSRPVVLGILITQVTPIVAFIPLIAFYFGRDAASVITIVVFSTIYPSYTIFLKALDSIPHTALEVIRGFGGNTWAELRKVRIPNAAWMSVVALRLAVGRAFLGAMTAEYLLTGTGLGGILGQTRSLLDFRFVWFICAIIALITFILDVLIHAFERRIRMLTNNFSHG